MVPRDWKLAIGQLISAQCKGTVMARLKNPAGVESVLIEPSPEAHAPEGLYIYRALVRDRREVPTMVLNATRRGTDLARYEALTLVAPHDDETLSQSYKT
jgi:hypothetical protein